MSRRWLAIALSILFVLLVAAWRVLGRLISDRDSMECVRCTSYDKILNLLGVAVLPALIVVVGFAAVGTWLRSQDR